MPEGFFLTTFNKFFPSDIFNNQISTSLVYFFKFFHVIDKVVIHIRSIQCDDLIYVYRGMKLA